MNKQQIAEHIAALNQEEKDEFLVKILTEAFTLIREDGIKLGLLKERSKAFKVGEVRVSHNGNLVRLTGTTDSTSKIGGTVAVELFGNYDPPLPSFMLNSYWLELPRIEDTTAVYTFPDGTERSYFSKEEADTYNDQFDMPEGTKWYRDVYKGEVSIFHILPEDRD